MVYQEVWWGHTDVRVDSLSQCGSLVFRFGSKHLYSIKTADRLQKGRF